MLDTDGNGLLSVDEMRAFYREMGLELDEEDTDLIAHLGVAGKITFQEFMWFMFSAGNDGIMLLASKMYDLNGDGKLSHSELRAAIVEELHAMPEMKLKAIMKRPTPTEMKPWISKNSRPFSLAFKIS